MSTLNTENVPQPSENGNMRQNPSSLTLRWAILFFSCLAMTGVYYSFDIPAALHQQLKDYMASSSSSNPSDSDDNYALKFNLLYSVYSIPNIILPFFGGTIVDKFGAHNSALIFASLTLLGQLLFAIGAQIQSWNMMLIGRTFYGFGGESISVATSTLNSKWFAGKELALSFGINLAVSRLGSVFNNFLSPTFANNYSTPVAIWVGVFMNFVSVASIGMICSLTLKSERILSRPRSIDEIDNDANSLQAALLEDYTEQVYDNLEIIDGNFEDNLQDGGVIDNQKDLIESRQDTRTLEHDLESTDKNEISVSESTSQIHDENTDEATIYYIKDEENEVNQKAPLLLDENIIQNNEIDFNDNSNEDEQNHSSIQCLNDVSKFGIMFWLVSTICIVVYGCVLPFNNIASGILLERNYFVAPPSDCELIFSNQCSSGTLAPTGGNPSVDHNGNACPTNLTDSNHIIQPILPTSIHVQRSEKNDDETTFSSWNHDSYQFDNLTSSNVDCTDTFWSKFCTFDYCKAQQTATEKSGRIMSISYFFSATFSPIFGYLVDKIGRRAIIASFASVLLIGVHLSLAMLTSSPVFPLVGQGLAYTFFASVIWPSVPLTVSENLVGTAFGTIVAIQNIGLAVFPMVIAYIYTLSDDHYIPNVEYFFVACAICGTIVGILLNIFDRRNGSILNKVQ